MRLCCLCRLFVVKELTNTVEEAGFEDSVNEVLPIMAELVDDPGRLPTGSIDTHLPDFNTIRGTDILIGPSLGG